MAFMRRFAVFLFVSLTLTLAQGEQPPTVSACQLKRNPTAYNHKLVEVTGFVSHGFEDFSLFDPGCLPWMGIWLEYGGTEKSGTMYCCGVSNSRSRPKRLQVEGIEIPLVDDEHFREFDHLVQQVPDRLVHATVIGRFFSGKPRRAANGEIWGGGYGHMGCCSLLAIQEVLRVDRQDREDIDYRASYEQPDIDKGGCGYRDLMSFEPFLGVAQRQRAADEKGPEWVFQEPDRVAAHELARLAKIDENRIRLKLTRSAQGHKVYVWRVKKDKSYMVVVSRPYLATFYARDAMKIAWTVVAAFEAGGDTGNSVSRIK